MFTIKHLKLWMYKHLARFYIGYLLFFLIAAAALVCIIWIKEVPLRPASDLWANIEIFALAAIWLLLFLTGIFTWLWYFVLFRYLAYGAAYVISLIRRLFKNTFFQFIIILVISAGFWVGRKYLFLGKKYHLKEILMFSQALKILVIAGLVFTIWKIYRSRKRIFISTFENYTGDKELKPAVKGVAVRILNEANRLSKLIKTIDEIHPGSKKGVIEPTVDVQEIGKDLSAIIGQESSVGIGNVKIPLRPVYALFNKLVHGPILSGGVHLKGNNLVITACLKGGNFKGSWEISTSDIKKPTTSRVEQLIDITDQLVCRIIAYISQDCSPRWKAMSHYTRALGFYRETLLKREKKKIKLIEAKNEFSLALTDDSEFTQCYYNLGVIYNELESYDAARAAFRKVLESEPDDYKSYHELARLYYNDENYFDARWFCEQALTIYPTDADHWNLWAVIEFKRWIKDKKDDYKKFLDIPGKVVQYFMNASALAWRALCKSIINGERTPQSKETARICIRNLAKITGMRKKWRSRCLFNQAIFLAPDNNDLHFEKGRYYYRKNKIEEAYGAFKRVFEDDKEVDDPFSYWAYYININAQLYRETKNNKKKDEYKKVVENGFFHFLDAAAEIIQKKKEKPGDMDIHEKQISDALNFEKREYGFLVGLNKILNGNFTSIDDWRNRTIQEMQDYIYKWSLVFRQCFPELSEGFLRWASAQADIKSAMLILDSGRNDDFPEVIYRLILAKELLEEYNPNEFKILGLYRYLGEAFYRLGLREQALEQAREAVKMGPYDWDVRRLLGYVYFDLNDYQKAVNEFEISARLKELSNAELIEIQKKIGEAHEENGRILKDPEQRKISFDKAVEFFTDSLELLGDKSYENKDEEMDEKYFDSLAKIHFSLGTVYRELLKYDDAIAHFEIARQMGYEILATLLNIGWIYFECGYFNEAEQAFRDAESNSVGTSAEIEINLGINLSRVERTLLTNIDDLPEDEKPKNILIGAEELLNAIERPREQSRLSALYYECRGRFFLNQEDLEEAEKGFKMSLSYRANPRVYYYLAELYWNRAGRSKGPLRNLYLAKTRSAFSLCLKNDFQEEYKKEVSELLENLSTLKKNKQDQ